MTEQDRKEFEAWWFPYAKDNQPSIGMAAHAAWLAALAHARKQQAELVEATEYLLFACRDGAVFQRDHAHQRATAALAQLKEQDDAK